MDRFKELFWVIFTEHAIFQVVIYSVVIAITSLVIFNSGFGFVDSVFYGLIWPLMLKTLSLLSSAFKAWYIIKKCKEDDFYFKQTYREWTGKHYF